jgi:hypothetical protein
LSGINHGVWCGVARAATFAAAEELCVLLGPLQTPVVHVCDAQEFGLSGFVCGQFSGTKSRVLSGDKNGEGRSK